MLIFDNSNKTGSGSNTVGNTTSQTSKLGSVLSSNKSSTSSTSEWNGIINPDSAFSGKQGASKLLGQISRAQWEDWRTNTAPVIMQLGEMATDQSYVADAQTQAEGAIDQSYTNARSNLGVSQERMGLSLSPEEKAVQDRKLGLSQAASKVSASNTAKIAAQDRQQQILAGTSGVSQSLYEDATG